MCGAEITSAAMLNQRSVAPLAAGEEGDAEATAQQGPAGCRTVPVEYPAGMTIGNSNRGGCLVVKVVKGNGAHRAGMRAGDVILFVNGTEVRNHDVAMCATRPCNVSVFMALHACVHITPLHASNRACAVHGLISAAAWATARSPSSQVMTRIHHPSRPEPLAPTLLTLTRDSQSTAFPPCICVACTSCSLPLRSCRSLFLLGLPAEDPLRVGASALIRAVTAPFVGAPGTQHRLLGHRRGSPLVPVPAGTSDEENDPAGDQQHPPASPLPSPPSQRGLQAEMWARFAA